MYRNILFDLYGTLVDIKTDESTQRFWTAAAAFFSRRGARYTCRELEKSYRGAVARGLAANKRTRYPDIKIVSVFSMLYAAKGVAPDGGLLLRTAEFFRAASTEHIGLYPGVEELLDKLAMNNKNMFIVSNGQREFSWPELVRLGIAGRFRALYSSSETGICKPDPAFLRYVLEKEGLDAGECLFVGDNPETDIAGAAAAGIDSALIVRGVRGREKRAAKATYEITGGDITKVLRCALRKA